MNPGTSFNITSKQQIKRHALLRLLRHGGPDSRIAFARALGTSNSLMCTLVDEMLAEDLLQEEHEGADRRGRRGIPVCLNPTYGHLLGFDMEAKRLRLIVSNFTGDRVWETEQRLRPVKDRQSLIQQILKFIETGYETVRPKFPRLMGIGLAASGVVDVRTGTILHYDLLEQARDIPLRDLVSARLNLPCVLEDNIRALTLAEWIRGAAQQLHSFVCVAIRSGVGAGIVLQGRLHTGSHGFAGEVGYMPVPQGQAAGQWRHLHDLVSESALGIETEARIADLPAAKAKRAGELLGVQLASLTTLIDPQAIVLSGAVVSPTSPLWEPMVGTFRRMVLPELAERVALLPARLGPYAAADGAAHRCFHMLYPTDAVEA